MSAGNGTSGAALLGSNIAKTLDGYTKAALQVISRRRRLLPGNASKQQLVEAIALAMLDTSTINLALNAIGWPERRALEWLVMRGGEGQTASLYRHLLRNRLVDKSDSYSYYNRRQPAEHDRPPKFEDVVAQLTISGLVLTKGWSSNGASPTLESPGNEIFIPDPVLAGLPPAVSFLPAAKTISVETSVESSPDIFQRDMFLYWRYALRNEISLTARGLVPKRQLAKIVEGLTLRDDVAAVSSEEDLGRTRFLRMTLVELGMLEASAGRLAPAQGSRDLLSTPSTERLRAAYRAYLRSRRWNELRRIPDISIDVGTKAYRDAVPEQILRAREFVIALLSKQPAGQWVSVKHLCELAAAVDREFLLPQQQHVGSYYSESRYYHSPYRDGGNYLGWTFRDVEDDENGWQRIEGGYISAILREALHWMGLVDLGFDGDRLKAFRLTELGFRMLRNEELPATIDQPGRVVIQPNFQVFAIGQVADNVLAMLDRFADLVTCERAIEFQLSRESVYRGQKDGLTVDEIIAYLEGAAEASLPQNVRRSLEEWAAHHERIVVRKGMSLVHSLTVKTLDAVYGDQALAAHLGKRLTPTAAIIEKGSMGLPGLASALFQRGYVPAISRGDHFSKMPVLTITEEGRIAFRQRLPNIYVWRRLGAFTEQRGGEHWITPASVQRAANTGMEASELIGRLGELHVGHLEPELVERIKAWAKHWGEVSLTMVHLLRVKDESTLAELEADPEIGPLLEPLKSDKPLALVRLADLDRLQSLFAQKGIPIADQ